METSWKPPLKFRYMPEELCQKMRDEFRIVIDGNNVPPPIPTFQVSVQRPACHSQGCLQGTWCGGPTRLPAVLTNGDGCSMRTLFA